MRGATVGRGGDEVAGWGREWGVAGCGSAFSDCAFRYVANFVLQRLAAPSSVIYCMKCFSARDAGFLMKLEGDTCSLSKT